MEMVERYIYAVTKRLPENQREDIEKELRGLIEDMLEERSDGEEPTSADIESVLLGLGDPAELADKYRGKNRYLIGPEYFDKYMLVLKIVLVASTFGILVSLLIAYSINPPVSIAELFGNVISSLFYALFQGFTWVTVVFVILEYKQISLKRPHGKREEFKPSDLPPVPTGDVRIRKSSPIVGIIFSVILLSILNFSPQLFGVKILGSAYTPIFNLDVLHSYIILINISFVCLILKEIIRIVYGRYNVPLVIGTIIFGLISLIITVIVFSDYNLWNVNFNALLLQNGHVHLPVGFDIINPMASVGKIFIGISIFAFVIEAIVAIIKTVRHTFDKI
jgi:hypothetical protein